MGPAGRFAPSPSGDLHVGNLRTALLAWLFARTSGRRALLRIEDLDRERSSRRSATRQIADLAALGLEWDEEIVYQSDRRELYDAAIDRLTDMGLTYPCFCTRKDIASAARAPHAPPGAYPGTCRGMDADLASKMASRLPQGRFPALRLAWDHREVEVVDRLAGRFSGVVDDLVLRRGDLTAAYNLAVVVDDLDQGVDQVVRGDDLLSSSPRQAVIAGLLGAESWPAEWVHVPLALGPDSRRLSKRHGAVTLADLAGHGVRPPQVLTAIAASLGLASIGEEVTAERLIGRFDPRALVREPWVVDAHGRWLGL